MCIHAWNIKELGLNFAHTQLINQLVSLVNVQCYLASGFHSNLAEYIHTGGKCSNVTFDVMGDTRKMYMHYMGIFISNQGILAIEVQDSKAWSIHWQGGHHG